MMYTAIFSSYLFFTSAYLIPSNFIISGLSNAVNTKIKFDKHMEKLEKNMLQLNKESICIESQKASSLINKNKLDLKKIEPNYDWEQINETLIETARKYCE